MKMQTAGPRHFGRSALGVSNATVTPCGRSLRGHPLAGGWGAQSLAQDTRESRANPVPES